MLWLEVGSPVTKSSAMCDQGLGGVGSGCNRRIGGLVYYLRLGTDQAG